MPGSVSPPHPDVFARAPLANAEAAQTVSRDHVMVTGAGFTCVPVPRAPRLADDFSNDTLEDMIPGPRKHGGQGCLHLLASLPDRIDPAVELQ